MFLMILLINTRKHHITINVNLWMLNLILLLNKMLILMMRTPNLKTFLLEDILLICQKTFMELLKLKILYDGLILLMKLMVKKLLERSIGKNCRRLIKKNLQ